MNRPSILVTGSGNVTGLNVVRALSAEGGIDLVGCDVESWNPANKYCVNYAVPRAADAAYIPRVLDIVAEHGIIGVIPSNDHELRALASHATRLEAAGAQLNARSAHQLAFLDKDATIGLFEGHGIATPRRVPLDGSTLPLVLRKTRVGEGQKMVRIVHTLEDLRAVHVPSDGSVVATEFLQGDEFTVDILSDLDARVLSVVPRLRRVVRHGIVLFGEVVRDQAVIDSATVLAQRLGLTGINCVQCIRQNERCYYFEVNARPGSGIDLSVAAGVNMPALWAHLLCGQQVHASEPDWGLKLVRIYDGYFFH